MFIWILDSVLSVIFLGKFFIMTSPFCKLGLKNILRICLLVCSFLFVGLQFDIIKAQNGAKTGKDDKKMSAKEQRKMKKEEEERLKKNKKAKELEKKRKQMQAKLDRINAKQTKLEKQRKDKEAKKLKAKEDKEKRQSLAKQTKQKEKKVGGAKVDRNINNDAHRDKGSANNSKLSKAELKAKLKADKRTKRLEARNKKKETNKRSKSNEQANQSQSDQNRELLSTTMGGGQDRDIQNGASSDKTVAIANRSDKLRAINDIDAINPLQIGGRLAAGLAINEVKGGVSGVSLGGTLGFGVTANMPVTHIPNEWRFQPEFNIQLAFLPNALPKSASVPQTPLKHYAIQIPLMLRYRAVPDFHLFAGPSLYLTMDVVNKDGNSLRTAVNTFNVGVTLGMNYLILPNFAFELRYNRRFLPLYDAKNINLKGVAPQLMQNSIIHNNVELGAVYFFKRNKKKIVKDITSDNLADLYQDGDIFNLSKQIDPNDDSDGDGVPYFKDACPTEQGSAWNNGCPADNDRDGVPNSKDSCIDIAGVLSNDGCPANDRDKDGIIDQLDACPKQKGPASNKGCPIEAEKPSVIVKAAGSDKPDYLQNSSIIALSNDEKLEVERILKGIAFKRGKSVLQDSSLFYVRSLASFIRSHKVEGTQFSIFANTVSSKSNAYNRQISVKRIRRLALALHKEGIITNKDIRYEGREDLLEINRGDKDPRTTLQLFWHKRLFPIDDNGNYPKVEPTPILDTMPKNLTFREARAFGLAQDMTKNLGFVKGKTQFRNKKVALAVLDKTVALMKEYSDVNLVVNFLYMGAIEEEQLAKIARERYHHLVKLLEKSGIIPERVITKNKEVPFSQKSSSLLYEFSFSGTAQQNDFLWDKNNELDSKAGKSKKSNKNHKTVSRKKVTKPKAKNTKKQRSKSSKK